MYPQPSAMAIRMTVTKRTEGDGMEHSVDDSMEKYTPKIHTQNESNSKNKKQNSSGLISIKPALVPERKKSDQSKKKIKEPKFVPYEPYKAAVRPIVPVKKSKLPLKKDDSRIRIFSSSSELTEDDTKSVAKFYEGDDVMKLEEEVKKLKIENSEMEKQLQLQVQVNGELKNLLVAAMGEDMETRVNCLAEDKQHLAQKLINTAKKLSTHQEQVEWLASQCEVWRSKFLASSVMVEELARWKASLSHKLSEGETVMKNILDERKQVRKNLLALHNALILLRDNFDLLSKRTSLRTSNVLDLSLNCLNITQGLVIQLLGGMKPSSETQVQELPHFTDAEKAADYMLKHPFLLSLIGEPDAACSAVVGAAVALHSQLYHQNNPPRIACCPQCTGQIKLV